MITFDDIVCCKCEKHFPERTCYPCGHFICEPCNEDPIQSCLRCGRSVILTKPTRSLELLKEFFQGGSRFPRPHPRSRGLETSTPKLLGPRKDNVDTPRPTMKKRPRPTGYSNNEEETFEGPAKKAMPLPKKKASRGEIPGNAEPGSNDESFANISRGNAVVHSKEAETPRREILKSKKQAKPSDKEETRGGANSQCSQNNEKRTTRKSTRDSKALSSSQIRETQNCVDSPSSSPLQKVRKRKLNVEDGKSSASKRQDRVGMRRLSKTPEKMKLPIKSQRPNVLESPAEKHSPQGQDHAGENDPTFTKPTHFKECHREEENLTVTPSSRDLLFSKDAEPMEISYSCCEDEGYPEKSGASQGIALPDVLHRKQKLSSGSRRFNVTQSEANKLSILGSHEPKERVDTEKLVQPPETVKPRKHRMSATKNRVPKNTVAENDITPDPAFSPDKKKKFTSYTVLTTRSRSRRTGILDDGSDAELVESPKTSIRDIKVVAQIHADPWISPFSTPGNSQNRAEEIQISSQQTETRELFDERLPETCLEKSELNSSQTKSTADGSTLTWSLRYTIFENLFTQIFKHQEPQTLSRLAFNVAAAQFRGDGSFQGLNAVSPLTESVVKTVPMDVFEEQSTVKVDIGQEPTRRNSFIRRQLSFAGNPEGEPLDVEAESEDIVEGTPTKVQPTVNLLNDYLESPLGRRLKSEVVSSEKATVSNPSPQDEPKAALTNQSADANLAIEPPEENATDQTQPACQLSTTLFVSPTTTPETVPVQCSREMAPRKSLPMRFPFTPPSSMKSSPIATPLYTPVIPLPSNPVTPALMLASPPRSNLLSTQTAVCNDSVSIIAESEVVSTRKKSTLVLPLDGNNLNTSTQLSLLGSSLPLKNITNTLEVTCSGIYDKRQVAAVHKVIGLMKAKFSSNLTKNTTHLIVPTSTGVNITPKFLMAIHSGAHILPFKWVVDCLETGSILEEKNYLIDHVGVRRRARFPRSAALFDRFVFYLSSEVQRDPVNFEALKDLMTFCDCKTVDKIEDLYYFPSFNKIVIRGDGYVPLPSKGDDEIVHVSDKWIFICLTMYQIQPTDAAVSPY